MKSGVSITKDNLAKMMKAMSSLPKQDVLVGIPESETDRESGDPATNAMLGYIHENGAPEANIPARPFLVPGIRDAKDKIALYLKQAGQAALEGNGTKMDRALGAAGMSAQTSVKEKIRTGPFAELSERTLAARRARGVTRTKPLIDTAQLLNSIIYVIRKQA